MPCPPLRLKPCPPLLPSQNFWTDGQHLIYNFINSLSRQDTWNQNTVDDWWGISSAYQGKNGRVSQKVSEE